MFFTKYLLAAAFALALGLVGLQSVRLAHEQAAHAQTRARHAEEMRAVSDTAARAAEKAAADMKQANAQLAALDARFTQEKTDDLKKIADLRAAVAARDKRLRVHAVCPASTGGGDVPAAAGASSVVDAVAPGLTADAEQNYFNLREQIATITTQAHGLQQYIREVCQP